MVFGIINLGTTRPWLYKGPEGENNGSCVSLLIGSLFKFAESCW